MQTDIKAINSKPAVSLNRAVGKLTFVAESLAESAIITAIVKMFVYGEYPELKDALAQAAKDEIEKMRDGEKFTMIPPKRTTNRGQVSPDPEP